MKAEILSLRTIHDGWTRFSLARVRLADGTEAEREIEDHGNSVGVLPYDPERRVATLVRELRVPALYAEITGEGRCRPGCSRSGRHPRAAPGGCAPHRARAAPPDPTPATTIGPGRRPASPGWA